MGAGFLGSRSSAKEKIRRRIFSFVSMGSPSGAVSGRRWPSWGPLGPSVFRCLPRRRKFVGAFSPSRKTGGVIGQPLGALGAVLGASWASGRPRRSPRPHVYERRGPGPHGERGSGGGRGAFSARSPPIGFVFGPWWGALGLSGGLLWLSRSARACRRHSAPGGVPGTS